MAAKSPRYVLCLVCRTRCARGGGRRSRLTQWHWTEASRPDPCPGSHIPWREQGAALPATSRQSALDPPPWTAEDAARLPSPAAASAMAARLFAPAVAPPGVVICVDFKRRARIDP